TGQSAFSDSHGTPGFDINIADLHEIGITGRGVHVAVVDSGLELGHEDLADNIVPGISYNFLNSSNDPSPSRYSEDGDHGTSVAGLIAAKANNSLGGRGVSPDAQLFGFNYVGTEEKNLTPFLRTHVGDLVSTANIINQSYGFETLFLLPLSVLRFELQEAALAYHYENNSDPALMIKSAGNGFKQLGYNIRSQIQPSEPEERRLPAQIANSDPENASFYNTVVSALSADADSPLAYYSTVGSSVMFSAPGGGDGKKHPAMITTDISGCGGGYSRGYFDTTGGLTQEIQDKTDCNYTSRFNGTSSAAPVASGVAALVMQANPSLTWRDVRYIMATTAKQVDAAFEPVVLSRDSKKYDAEPGWTLNSAGHRFHNWYGFGMLDAKAAVEKAKSSTYDLLPPLEITDFKQATDLKATTIPETFDGVSKQVVISGNQKIEAVQLKLDLSHGRPSDLAIEIISPTGTRSVVATPRNLHFRSIGEKFEDLLFLSHAFLDEESAGAWTVKVTDTKNDSLKLYGLHKSNGKTSIGEHAIDNNKVLGTLHNVELRIYGHRG
ncbi:S8 family serine peptidase, partial [Veronia pacifica]